MNKTMSEAVIKKINPQDDFIAQGFHKLDDNLIEKKPPKIQWGQKYQQFTDKEKIKYLENIASTMNHAAHLIQTERDELGKLCELKEEQLINMKSAMSQNMEMLQTEITKINEERQLFNAAYKELKDKK
jgi:hypothetical protein